jgi:hypothetical protein
MKIYFSWAMLILAMLSITYFAAESMDDEAYLWIFTILGIALLCSIRLGRFSFFYTFMVIFFLLGCWLKVVIHNIVDYSYIEPIGLFSGLEKEWDLYFLNASLFTLALITARLFCWVFESNKKIQNNWQFTTGPVRSEEWCMLVVLAVVFYTINHFAAFYVTGINSKVVLPLKLNAPFAFMAFIGFALILSIYVARDVTLKQYLDQKTVILILVITGIASVSMASRAAILMQAIPMLVAASCVQATAGVRALSIRPFLLFGVFFAITLSLVAIYRVNVFLGESMDDLNLLTAAVIENVQLVVDRWVGAEAIMVGVSEPTSSVDLMFQLLQEDPSEGVGAIYQTLSGGKYEYLDGLTFLTLPGYFGLFSLSGSEFVVLSFTILMTLAGIGYESFLRRALFEQSICVAVISVALANAFTQLSFPRLLIPFIFQMTVLVLIMHYFLRSRVSQLK